MSTLEEIAKKIEDNSVFVIHCHTSPDPDTIGSVLGLKLALESIGKIVHAYCEDEIIAVARFLPGVDDIQKISMREALTYKYDQYISLDTAKWDLCTHGSDRPTGEVINIDHHPDNVIQAKYSFVDPKSASTAQMIMRLIELLKIEITEDIATCLLFGILGDTGVFQNTNTDSRCFGDTQRLLEFGAHYHECVLHLTRSYIYEDIRLWGNILKDFKISPDRRYVWATLGHDDYQKLDGGVKVGLIANNFAGRIEGTLFGAVIVEKDKGYTRGSLRSRIPDFDVSSIARLLGGGGHKASASFMIEEGLEKAEQKFLKAVKSVVEAHDKQNSN